MFPQGNLIEDIKQLQERERQVNNRVTELTQMKETSRVSADVLLIQWQRRRENQN